MTPAITPRSVANSSKELHITSTYSRPARKVATAREVFTLGQLFTQWGVKLTSTQIGGVRDKDGQKVTLTSNGAPVTGDPADLRLQPEQKIVLELS